MKMLLDEFSFHIFEILHKMDGLRVTMHVCVLSRSDPATLKDQHLGSVESNLARMRKKVRDLAGRMLMLLVRLFLSLQIQPQLYYAVVLIVEEKAFHAYRYPIMQLIHT